MNGKGGGGGGGGGRTDTTCTLNSWPHLVTQIEVQREQEGWHYDDGEVDPDVVAKD